MNAGISFSADILRIDLHRNLYCAVLEIERDRASRELARVAGRGPKLGVEALHAETITMVRKRTSMGNAVIMSFSSAEHTIFPSNMLSRNCDRRSGNQSPAAIFPGRVVDERAIQPTDLRPMIGTIASRR